MRDKETVVCQVYLDGQLFNEIEERRVVYLNGDGIRYIKSMGRRHELNEMGQYRVDYRRIIPDKPTHWG